MYGSETTLLTAFSHIVHREPKQPAASARGRYGLVMLVVDGVVACG
jgi:hypothetical protein